MHVLSFKYCPPAISAEIPWFPFRYCDQILKTPCNISSSVENFSRVNLPCSSIPSLCALMARTSTALKSISAPRKHKQKTHKSAPLTQQQKKEKQARREEKQAAIGRAFHEWHSATMAKAEELAIQFNRKPRYFLDLFFHGGAKMVNQRTSVTAWNAWSSKIMEEENDGAHHIR
jgi:hypothetical protein